MTVPQTVPTAEFSRRVPLDGLAAAISRYEIAAGPEEREALAARFDLEALDSLAAIVELRRGSDGIVLLEATFEAEFVQSCVVTLEPVRGTISQSFALRYGPPATEGEIPPAADEPAFEPLCGDAIDIGEAVSQELSLQLPAFPRLPEASLDVAGEVGGETEPDDGAFAALVTRRGHQPA
jgi:uncharacterized metal-binding protein YceD (DUF177 family)